MWALLTAGICTAASELVCGNGSCRARLSHPASARAAQKQPRTVVLLLVVEVSFIRLSTHLRAWSNRRRGCWSARTWSGRSYCNSWAGNRQSHRPNLHSHPIHHNRRNRHSHPMGRRPNPNPSHHLCQGSNWSRYRYRPGSHDRWLIGAVGTPKVRNTSTSALPIIESSTLRC